MDHAVTPFATVGQSAGAAALAEARWMEFDEAAYLIAFPDIADAVVNGELHSAFRHYSRHGVLENRLHDERYLRALTGDARAAESAEPGLFPPCSVDAVFVSPDGFCLVIGWSDDRADPLEMLAITTGREPRGATRRIARCRRPDAESAIGLPAGTLLGYWALISVPPGSLAAQECNVMVAAGGKRRYFAVQPRYLPDVQFRDTVFEYFVGAGYFGNPAVESFLQLERGPGPDLLRLNARISAGIARGAHAEHFGPRGSGQRLRGSIIVCLYGKHEFFFVQSALFSLGRAAHDYEFIYISNSPELTEILQKEAKITERIYGLRQTLVFLPGNAGFGAANNAAARFANSDRLLIVNPDVFPRDDDWAERHTKILDGLPAERTQFFGAPLFYDDGSLMHGGMYFEIDHGLSARPEGITRQSMARVSHYGKGAPPTSMTHRRSRPVPAVSGAFMSIDRRWFETLGGFSEEYVFGHYEDADLCLKSLDRGCAVWLNDLPLWHLEGKGSIRRPVHEGGSLVNRWHFTKTWGDFIETEFCTSVPRAAQPRGFAA